MTDFLTNLTARSFGREAAILPRVASLFEPVSAVDSALGKAAAAEPAELVISREVETASDGAWKMSHLASSSQDDESAADGSPEKDAVIASMVRRRRFPPSQEQSWAESHPAPFSQAGLDVREPRKSFPQSNLEDSEPKAPSSESDLDDRALKVSFSGSDLDDAAKKRAPAIALQASSARDQSLERDNRGLVIPPQVVTVLTAQMKNAASAMNVGSHAPPREEAAIASPALAAAEPSVHVTIGRIEVRATSESKPTGRARTVSPVMSLEEYLHRRTRQGDR